MKRFYSSVSYTLLILCLLSLGSEKHAWAMLRGGSDSEEAASERSEELTRAQMKKALFDQAKKKKGSKLTKEEKARIKAQLDRQLGESDDEEDDSPINQAALAALAPKPNSAQVTHSPMQIDAKHPIYHAQAIESLIHRRNDKLNQRLDEVERLQKELDQVNRKSSGPTREEVERVRVAVGQKRAKLIADSEALQAVAKLKNAIQAAPGNTATDNRLYHVNVNDAYLGYLEAQEKGLKDRLEGAGIFRYKPKPGLEQRQQQISSLKNAASAYREELNAYPSKKPTIQQDVAVAEAYKKMADQFVATIPTKEPNKLAAAKAFQNHVKTYVGHLEQYEQAHQALAAAKTPDEVKAATEHRNKMAANVGSSFDTVQDAHKRLAEAVDTKATKGSPPEDNSARSPRVPNTGTKEFVSPKETKRVPGGLAVEEKNAQSPRLQRATSGFIRDPGDGSDRGQSARMFQVLPGKSSTENPGGGPRVKNKVQGGKGEGNGTGGKGGTVNNYVFPSNPVTGAQGTHSTSKETIVERPGTNTHTTIETRNSGPPVSPVTDPQKKKKKNPNRDPNKEPPKEKDKILSPRGVTVNHYPAKGTTLVPAAAVAKPLDRSKMIELMATAERLGEKVHMMVHGRLTEQPTSPTTGDPAKQKVLVVPEDPGRPVTKRPETPIGKADPVDRNQVRPFRNRIETPVPNTNPQAGLPYEGQNKTKAAITAPTPAKSSSSERKQWATVQPADGKRAEALFNVPRNGPVRHNDLGFAGHSPTTPPPDRPSRPPVVPVRVAMAQSLSVAAPVVQRFTQTGEKDGRAEFEKVHARIQAGVQKKWADQDRVIEAFELEVDGKGSLRYVIQGTRAEIETKKRELLEGHRGAQLLLSKEDLDKMEPKKIVALLEKGLDRVNHKTRNHSTLPCGQEYKGTIYFIFPPKGPAK